MKLGILNADQVKPEFVKEFGEYPDMFAEIFRAIDPDISLITYELVNGEYPADVDEVDVYVITGSKLSVYDDVPWVHELKSFVKQLHEKKKKLIGICFGHQMVAEALGGAVEQAELGWCVGVHSNQLNKDAESYGLHGQAVLLRSNHKDQVTELPEGAIVLAGNNSCPISSIGIGDHILTFQGHPEFSEGYARALLNMRREIFGEELFHTAIDSLEIDPDNHRIASCIIDFVSR